MEETENVLPNVPVTNSEPEITSKPTKNYLKILVIANMLLFVAIVVLFVMFFIQKSKQKNDFKIPAAASYFKPGGLKVAFVNSDSIKAHYQLVKDMQKQLEQKYSHFDNDISGKQKALEARAKDLQDRFEKKLISMEEAQKADEQLKLESKRLYDLNQDYTGKMSEEESKMNLIFIDSIHNFLKRYNSKMQFDYVLGYSKGGGILFARDTLDITKEVLETLNHEYLKNKPGK